MSAYGTRGSRVGRIDRSNKNDCEVVYSDSTHMCVMKLCPAVDEDPTLPLDDYKRYHIRYYIPKFALSTKDKKIRKIIFMFNGLNEVDHYTLYDQIGQVLCQRGIAAALIPLPDHLHRHTKWRLAKPNESQSIETPLDSIKKNPDYLHRRLLQFSQEVKHLQMAISNCHTYEGDFPFCFYRNLFDCEIRISCLGYSMGGLAALSLFLENPRIYNACFLLNSGIQLKDIKLPDSMISSDDWEKLVETASEHFVEQAGDSYSKIFGQLFLGNRPAETIKKLRPLTKRILFIFGGSDSVIPMKSIGQIEPQGKGLPIFQIPGISHFPAIDREWNNWYSLTVNLIAEFEENASRSHWSKQELVETIIDVNNKCHFFKSPNKWDVDKITDKELFDRFYQAYYSHHFFYPNFQTLLAEAILVNHKRNLDAGNNGKIKFLKRKKLRPIEITEVLKAQIVNLRKGHYRRSGALAKTMNFLK